MIKNNKRKAKDWFFKLRNELVTAIEELESETFNFTSWKHSGEGGGVMGSIKGKIIEKGGVNISTVSGNFSKKMQKEFRGQRMILAIGLPVLVWFYIQILRTSHQCILTLDF